VTKARVKRTSPARMKARSGAAPLDRLRRICLALPGTTETMTWGHPNFRAGKKIFAAFEVWKGEECICFKTEPPMQDLLLGEPQFFRAPYVGNRGWVSMKTKGRIEWKRLKSLIEESYRLVAG
jgi:predicted DNA-binding protein (MmcQ/YjbR family)